jgi:sulfite exporter TauE/SafE
LDSALVASAALLGLAGAPHCAAMCAAPCRAASGPGAAASVGFQLARLASYALAGAVAAAGVEALVALSRLSPALRPLWALLQAGALALGLWLLWRGRQPQWLARFGRASQGQSLGGWQRISGPGRAVVAGGLWVAWPCGLLQSALLVAAMTQSATAGAAAMAGFAIASSVGLWGAAWAWSRLNLAPAAGARAEAWAVRAGGALLAGAAAWALGVGLWHRVAAWCLPP